MLTSSSHPLPLQSTALLLLALLLGATSACDTSTPHPSIRPNILTDGASWTYDIRFTESPVDSSIVDTVLTTTVRMQVTTTGIRLGDRSGLIELTSFEQSSPDSVQRTWYQQSPDSLVEVAYEFGRVPGIPLSKASASPTTKQLQRGLMGLPHLVRQQLSPSSQRASTTDTTLRDDSRIVLQTPLEKGASWTSFRDPFLSTRTVAGRTTVETRAGQFEAVEIRNTLPELALSLQWSDYYAATGLVRRVLTDTLKRRNDEGERLGRVVSREVYTLTDIQN